jgi:hypothetical protein
MQDFAQLLKDHYDTFDYYAPPTYGHERDSRCIAIEVENPEKVIQDITNIARKRGIQMPDLAFLNFRVGRFILYWPLDEE